MSRMPPRLFSSLSRSRVSWSTSFLVRPAVSPDSCSSRLLKRLIELEMVFQLVSMPPSQRWLTKCWPEARAASATASCAWRLVPTNSTLPPRATAWLDEFERAREQRHALRQVDDVNAVAVAEDVRLHPRVPAVGLVAEMGASFEQLLHRDDGGRHRIVSFRLCLGQRLKPVLRPAPVWWPCLWDGGPLADSPRWISRAWAPDAQ